MSTTRIIRIKVLQDIWKIFETKKFSFLIFLNFEVLKKMNKNNHFIIDYVFEK